MQKRAESKVDAVVPKAQYDALKRRLDATEKELQKKKRKVSPLGCSIANLFWLEIAIVGRSPFHEWYSVCDVHCMHGRLTRMVLKPAVFEEYRDPDVQEDVVREPDLPDRVLVTVGKGYPVVKKVILSDDEAAVIEGEAVLPDDLIDWIKIHKLVY
jgi:hypothetical protein